MNQPSTSKKPCPYCAEPIRAAATFCRYCRQGLPPIDAEPPRARKDAHRVQPAHGFLAVVLAGMVTTVPSMVLVLLINEGRIDFPSGTTLDRILFGSLAPVFLCGLWASWAWPGRRVADYAGLGAIAAVIDFLLVGGLLASFLPKGPYAVWVPFEAKEVAASVGILALFTAGALGGEVARRYRASRAPGKGIYQPKFADGRWRAGSAGSDPKFVMASALGPPALGLVGTILTAVVSESPLK